jgi:aspartate/methionine/tyrosine aminotransferase
VSEQDGFQFNVERVERHIGPQTRALLLNSPSNPTGTLACEDRMREIARVMRDRALIISDEVYHGLVYQGRAHSILEFTDQAIVVNGFSKLYAMTGWRLGYTIVPPYLVRPLQRVQQNLFVSPPDFAQFAGIAALTEAGEAVAAMKDQYDQRRRYVLQRLGAMNLAPATEPTGAFYVFVQVAHLTDNVYKFAFELLEEAGVAVTPGIDFGHNGEGYLRVAYTRSLEELTEGMDRLQRFILSR